MKGLSWHNAGALIVIVVGFLWAVGLLSQKDPTQEDFIEYWAAGHQLFHGADPYSIPAIVQLERGAGLDSHEPRISLSPPIALAIVLPLGLLGAHAGLIEWTLLLVACLALSIRLLWRMHGAPNNRIHLAGYLCAPAILCVMSGQISIFLLLGIVLFLYSHASHPVLAGAALLPLTLKPQMFLPFALVMLAWVVYRRAFRIVLGFLAAVAVSMTVVLCFDHQVWAHYFELTRHVSIVQVFIPTLSTALRFLIDRNSMGLQFVLAVAGSVWALWYFATRRAVWSWKDNGPLLLFVSVMCAPYGFFNDECLLLPVLLAGIYGTRDRRWYLPLAVINGLALTEILLEVNIDSPFYLWTAPVSMVWYLCATRAKVPSAVTSAAQKRRETAAVGDAELVEIVAMKRSA